MANEDMGYLVDAGNKFFNVALLATAVASPVVICLWASVLFVAGMIDYILESDLGGLMYRIFAAIPVGFGVITVVMTLILGETIDKRMRAKVRLLFITSRLDLSPMEFDEQVLSTRILSKTEQSSESLTIQERAQLLI